MGKDISSKSYGFFILAVLLGFILGGLAVYLYLNSGEQIKCDRFKQPSLRSACYINLAIDRKDLSICSRAAPSVSVNSCYIEFAVANLEPEVCARIDDPLLKDTCYNRVGVLKKDKSVCDKIQDIRGRQGCYNEIGEENKVKQEKQITNVTKENETKQTEIINITDEERMKQNLTIVSAYLCGPDICFQIKAPSTNTKPISMADIRYYIGSSRKEISEWSGGYRGTPCTSLTYINVNQNCFARILNTTCYIGDRLRVSIVGGTESSKEISGCK